MHILVGNTGFVGSNIAKAHHFDSMYNSKNIASAIGLQPDLLVYAGVPASMELANNNPVADREVCENAINNIRNIHPKCLVLISTISVLDKTINVDEDYHVRSSGLQPYGANRFFLEQKTFEIVRDCHIIRLPALFGDRIKKNFVYDLIHFVPAMLDAVKYEAFACKEQLIQKCYKLSDNGFYMLMQNDPGLKDAFKRIGFSALNFTDSRSVFQFYNLTHLWSHIELVLKNDLPLLHTAVEPISAAQVYQTVTGNTFLNELTTTPYNYDYRTKYNDCLGGENGYIFKQAQIMQEIIDFVAGYSHISS
jgi:hypothetical protein